MRGWGFEEEAPMAQSLWDHQLRLHDLEVAIEALRGVLSAEPRSHSALREAAQTLRSRGHKGAADLLMGERAAAAYRR
jgi:hypothetical protein